MSVPVNTKPRVWHIVNDQHILTVTMVIIKMKRKDILIGSIQHLVTKLVSYFTLVYIDDDIYTYRMCVCLHVCLASIKYNLPKYLYFYAGNVHKYI